MIKRAHREILWNTLPILLGIVLSGLLWRHNILLLIVYIVLIAILLKIKSYPGDKTALVYGFFVGTLVEVIGTRVSGYQSFTNPNFWGIPIWLPVVWGYGFMMMKRIGVAISDSRRNF